MTNSKNIGLINDIIKHQEDRFKELDFLLLQSEKKPNKLHIIIPGNSKTNQHFLGANIAQHTWNSIDSTGNLYNLMIQNLNKLISQLMNKYPKQVVLGNVGYGSEAFPVNSKKIPSNKYIHVWGANENNWNQPDGSIIRGLGQAQVMKKQTIGIFGIVTMPSSTKAGINVKNSKYLLNYADKHL